MTDLAWFWAWAAWYALKAAWDGLPGPWYVKVALLVACQLIPGQLDEFLLLAIVAAWRRHKRRRASRLLDSSQEAV